MKIEGQLLTIPFEFNIAGKPILHNKIKIGEITKSYLKDGKVWVVFTVDKNKQKAIKKLLKEIKRFSVSVNEEEPK